MSSTTPFALRCILLKFYIKPQRWYGWNQWQRCCILLKFYIKPQLSTGRQYWGNSCILLKFYIKPQLTWLSIMPGCCCILLKFYIKPQLDHRQRLFQYGCILLKFYIKPQLSDAWIYDHAVVSYWNSTSNHNSVLDENSELDVVSYWNSTSNHNCDKRRPTPRRLYLIEILHQTTTLGLILIDKVLLTGCLPL